ncbi:MAG TPA: DinB family protein [Dehalococcoidia bacterium]|nr:DinB family protein [Dehalococcoidia bacterium]
MATVEGLAALLTRLDRAVEETLCWFQTWGDAPDLRVDQWTPREVLAHLVFWHQVNLQGMVSAVQGGPPHRLLASSDDLNARAVARLAGKSSWELATELRALHKEVSEAAPSLPSLDVVVRIQLDGTERTARQQLEGLETHLREHLQELQKLTSSKA